MNINTIIEEVTGEKGKWFLLNRDKIIQIVDRAIAKTIQSPVAGIKTYEQGLEEGEKIGYEKRSDELYEQAVIGNYNNYIDKPDTD